VALVRLAQAAGVGRGSRGRQRERNEVSGKREQQEQSGNQALHAW